MRSFEHLQDHAGRIAAKQYESRLARRRETANLRHLTPLYPILLARRVETEILFSCRHNLAEISKLLLWKLSVFFPHTHTHTSFPRMRAARAEEEGCPGISRHRRISISSVCVFAISSARYLISKSCLLSAYRLGETHPTVTT